jgi:hypothetical protein
MTLSHENDDHVSFDIPHLPLPLVPRFVRRMGALATEIGFANATMDTLDAAGIKVDVEGDALPEEGEGLIVASDHRQRIEPLLVQAVMSLSERTASHVLAMPISFAGRIMQASGEIGKELVIPVVPRNFSAENKPSLRQPRNFVRRNLHPETLKVPKEKLKVLNDTALTHASKIAQTGTITIFPTGGNADLPWHRGFGQIVDQIPEDTRENVSVTLMRPDTFSVKRVMAALVARDLGIELPEQRLVVRTRLLGNAHEVFKEQENTQQISDKAHALYQEEFHK